MADRLITINIRKYLVTQPRTKRARKAVKYIRERVAHYTKLKPENVKLGYDLNNLIFKYYSIRMVPVKVRVKIGTDTADVLPFIDESMKKTAAASPTAPKTAPTTPQKKPEEAKKPMVSIKKKETPQNAQPQPQPQNPEKKQ